MPNDVRLTKAQERALEWFPSDGAWRINAGKLGSAVSSFCLYHRDLSEYQWGDFGPKGGRALRFRLTTSGVRFKAARATGGGG